jgi:hypothetical protein
MEMVTAHLFAKAAASAAVAIFLTSSSVKICLDCITTSCLKKAELYDNQIALRILNK